VERKESHLLKVMVSMPQANPIIEAQEPGVAFKAWIVNAANLLVDNYNIRSTTPAKGFGVGDSIMFLSWLGCSTSPS
jgi:hypothetical protein